MWRRPRLVFGLATFLALVSVVLLNVTFAGQIDYKIALIVGNVAGLGAIAILAWGSRRGSRCRRLFAVVVAVPVLFFVADTGRRIPYALGLFPHGYRFLIPEGYKGTSASPSDGRTPSRSRWRIPSAW
jgi:hypothetical protein